MDKTVRSGTSPAGIPPHAAGTRPPLALLPGMMCDERLFAPQRCVLEPHYEVRCARFVDGDAIEDFAHETLALFPDTDDPIDLIGLSMGGIVAMACMAMAPERIGRVMLMDTNAAAETDERRALRTPQIERALNGELDRLLIEEMKPLYLAPANRDDEALLALVLDMARTLGPQVFARQSRALAGRTDQRSTLAGWRGPLRLLCGEHDALCPPSHHHQMATLAGRGQACVIEDAGHLPTLEAAEATNRAVLAFLVGE